MGLVIFNLLRPTPLGLIDGAAHRTGDLVGVEDRLARGVAGRPADGLDQGALRAQEPLLVRIKDRHQGDLRHIQSLPQQVDADQYIKYPQAQVTDDLHPLNGIDIGVEITHPDTVVIEVIGKILSHPFGQGGDQHPLLLLHPQVDLRQQIIHLGAGGTHLQLWVEQAGGAHHLFDHRPGVLQFIRPWGGGDVDLLRGLELKLLKPHGTVVEGGGETKTILHQSLLA